VWWVVSIATASTPAVSEITAGVNVTNFIAKDGVARGVTTNNVDSATIAEIFDAQVVGSWGGEMELTMFRDAAIDTAWNLFNNYGSTGYVVIDPFHVVGTNPTQGSKVEVWPAMMHTPASENSAPNTNVRFTEKLAITSTPYLSAVAHT
jgi:hypothetical protein